MEREQRAECWNKERQTCCHFCSCTDTIRISGREMHAYGLTVWAVGTLDLKGLVFVKADASRKHSGFMHLHSQLQGASAWFIESNYWPSVRSSFQRLALWLCNWCRIHQGSDLGFPKNKKGHKI